jgi:transposase
MKKYLVSLTAEESQQLRDLIAVGKASAKKLAHARILLKADVNAGGSDWTDTRIAAAVEVSIATVERVRQRFVEQGLTAALSRKPQDQPSRERTLDGRAEAYLIALACTPPPQERTRWTVQLLADKLVELQIVETISDETVRRVLKKTFLSRG